MLNRLAHFALTGVLLIGAASANAGLIFVVDGSASSASITNIADGFVCSLTSCGIDVSLAPGLDGTMFELETGDAFSFDFLTFTGSGSGAGIYSVTATLAFSQPSGANATGSGIGAALFVAGQIVAGALDWTNLPTQIILPQGSTIGINFEDGLALLAGNSVTTGASVTGTAVVVPEPGALWLLGLGLLALGCLRWRRPYGTE